jgi:transcriptional regulator GlxA family with amidase domain
MSSDFTSFLVGTLTRPWLLRAGRRVETLGIRFRHGQLRRLFGFRMAAATDREVPLGQLAGARSARELMLTLDGSRTDRERFEVAETWLLRILREEPRSMDRSPCQPALGRIREGRGQVRIDAVAAALGWSRRRMERIFQDEIGVSPKLYSRIVRLNAVLAALDDSERPRAVDFALEAGYFDQPHLLRDFGALVGRTPRTSHRTDGEMARHFTDPNA